MTLMASFALIALVLTGGGAYAACCRYTVARRRREIGVRIARWAPAGARWSGS